MQGRRTGTQAPFPPEAGLLGGRGSNWGLALRSFLTPGKEIQLLSEEPPPLPAPHHRPSKRSRSPRRRAAWGPHGQTSSPPTPRVRVPRTGTKRGPTGILASGPTLGSQVRALSREEGNSGRGVCLPRPPAGLWGSGSPAGHHGNRDAEPALQLPLRQGLRGSALHPAHSAPFPTGGDRAAPLFHRPRAPECLALRKHGAGQLLVPPPALCPGPFCSLPFQDHGRAHHLNHSPWETRCSRDATAQWD